MPLFGEARQPTNPDQELQILLYRILSSDCFVRSQRVKRVDKKKTVAMNEVQVQKSPFEEAQNFQNKKALALNLIKVVKDGPDKTRLRHLRQYFQRNWERREAYLQSDPKGLSPGHIALLKKRFPNEETYVNEKLKQIKRKYTSNAKLALATMGYE